MPVNRPPYEGLTIEQKICRTFRKDCKNALRIAKAESGMRCGAVNKNTNKTTDHSVFQINSIHTWRGDIINCDENIKIAYQIFQKQGWKPWVAAKKLKLK